MSQVPLLRGIVPPLVAPIDGAGRLDLEALDRLVDHVLAGGVHGLFVLGTTGEGPSLSGADRREAVRRVCRRAGGRVPVAVGIGDTAPAESAALAAHAAEQGAAAVVLAPPSFFAPSPDELAELIADLAARSPLPVLLYNLPGLTGVRIGLETVRRAIDLPDVIGFKDSSRDLVFFHRLVQLVRADRPDWALFIGPEELLADALLFGADGGVNAGANLVPAMYVELYEAARAGDLERVRSLHARVMRLAEIYLLEDHDASSIKGLKAALACLGICGPHLAPPLHALRDLDQEAVRHRLVELGVAPGATVDRVAAAGLPEPGDGRR